MSTPQVNATVTDRNREQTKRICELRGYAYYPEKDLDVEYKHGDGSAIAWRGVGRKHVRLPNGSFTLCQVVGMLNERGWQFVPRDVGDYKGGYWMKRRADMVWQDLGYIKDVHSLTENADSLIKLLEKNL